VIDMALSAADKRSIAEMIAAAVVAAQSSAVVADTDDEDSAEVVAVKSPRKRKGTQSTKNAPKATAARRKRGEKVSEWTVRASWKGETPSPRMLGTAVAAGVSAKVLRSNCKLTVSTALGQAYGLPVVTKD
jgi:hypothetical protein